MKDFVITKGYKSPLSVRETQRAIKFIKDTFQKELAARLCLERISAPLIVRSDSGLNDDLNGIERKVCFDLAEFDGQMEVVQSLAKWKRTALAQYGFVPGEGLYTDMNAIRRDDDVDNLHSVFVDQWDWEKVITRADRTVEYFKNTVKDIVAAVVAAKEKVCKEYPVFQYSICPEVFFISSQELEDLYPALSPKEREWKVVREHRTVCVTQIGKVLKSGIRHDGRAPDYDDWSLNGDLLFWDDVLQKQIEISSMGIRVDKDSLLQQLAEAGCEERLRFPYHQGIVNETLPLTIGGGIGQSRLCLLLLEKMHVGEVQASVWPDDQREACAASGAILL